MPITWHPMTLPATPDGCDGRAVFIDATTVSTEPALTRHAAPSRRDERARGAPGAIVSALVLARWKDRRYPMIAPMLR